MKTINLIFVGICLTVASAASIPSEFVSSEIKSAIVKPRIIDGKNAEEGQFPYQVSLRYVNGFHFCGASIIGNRFILTAAHCVFGEDAIKIIAVVGALRVSQGGVKMNIDRIIQHEKFDLFTSLRYDIALIRTAEEIVFSETVQPIALPTQKLPVEENVAVVLSGWGANRYGDLAQMPDILQFAELNTIGLADCPKLFEKYDPEAGGYLSEENVCALSDTPNRGCKGDSGGPLVEATENRSVVGIVSFNTPECSVGYPDAFTGVYSYIDWIHQKIEEHSDF